MTIFEDYVIKKVQNGSSIKGLYPLTNKEKQDEYNNWLKTSSDKI